MLSYEGSIGLLRSGEYGFLSLAGGAYAYGVPLSYALEGNSIYFHCAPNGEKIRRIALDNRVSFCVVGPTEVLSSKFSVRYTSVMAFGRIRVLKDPEEKRLGLILLARKYSPDYPAESVSYIGRAINGTCVLRMDVEHLTGKDHDL